MEEPEKIDPVMGSPSNHSGSWPDKNESERGLFDPPMLPLSSTSNEPSPQDCSAYVTRHVHHQFPGFRLDSGSASPNPGSRRFISPAYGRTTQEETTPVSRSARNSAASLGGIPNLHDFDVFDEAKRFRRNSMAEQTFGNPGRSRRNSSGRGSPKRRRSSGKRYEAVERRYSNMSRDDDTLQRIQQEQQSKPGVCALLKRIFCLLPETRDTKIFPSNEENGSPKPPRPRRHSAITEILPFQGEEDEGKPVLLLGLEGTLVHSSLKEPAGKYDLCVPFSFMGRSYQAYVQIRPHAETLLSKLKRKYEIVIFTDNLKVYANQVIDRLNASKSIRWRLFRDSCSYCEGKYVKDLRYLGRDLSQTILIDCSPSSYRFQPENSLPCSTFRGSPSDEEFKSICTFLQSIHRGVDDVRPLLRTWTQQNFMQWKNEHSTSTESRDAEDRVHLRPTVSHESAEPGAEQG
eukprot:gb/GECG01011615.1/.p1 GENE.gb/GECG01011615.1/~~gb/GECG01011615.1/.p1  ORF type:complete len:460 (+),score=49.83 gb/GECG01011615.1/:1-1380(+)